MATTEKERIAHAIQIAVDYGGIDGDHHKRWVIDQMVRALTDCPMEERSAVDHAGNAYVYKAQGESEAYRRIVREACDGEEGPDTYEWDTGVIP